MNSSFLCLIRMITEKEIEPLKKSVKLKQIVEDLKVCMMFRIYEESSVDESFIHFLKDHHRKPLTLDEGKSVYSHK